MFTVPASTSRVNRTLCLNFVFVQETAITELQNALASREEELKEAAKKVLVRLSDQVLMQFCLTGLEGGIGRSPKRTPYCFS